MQETFSVGDIQIQEKPRDPKNTNVELFQATFRIDPLKTQYTKTTYGLDSFVSIIGGAMKTLMVIFRYLAMFVAQRLFMSDIFH